MRSTTRRMLFPVITIGWPEEKGPRSLSQLLSIGNVDDRRGRTCGSWSIFMPRSLFPVRKHELFIPLGTKMRNSNRAMHSWYPNSVLTSCQTVPWELVLWSGPKVQAYTVSLTLFSSPHHGQNSSPFLLLLPLLPWLLSGLSKCPWASFFFITVLTVTHLLPSLYRRSMNLFTWISLWNLSKKPAVSLLCSLIPCIATCCGTHTGGMGLEQGPWDRESHLSYKPKPHHIVFMWLDYHL